MPTNYDDIPAEMLYQIINYATRGINTSTMSSDGRHHLHFPMKQYAISKRIYADSMDNFYRTNGLVIVETNNKNFMISTVQFVIPIKRISLADAVFNVRRILIINLHHGVSKGDSSMGSRHFVICAGHLPTFVEVINAYNSMQCRWSDSSERYYIDDIEFTFYTDDEHYLKHTSLKERINKGVQMLRKVRKLQRKTEKAERSTDRQLPWEQQWVEANVSVQVSRSLDPADVEGILANTNIAPMADDEQVAAAKRTAGLGQSLNGKGYFMESMREFCLATLITGAIPGRPKKAWIEDTYSSALSPIRFEVRKYTWTAAAALEAHGFALLNALKAKEDALWLMTERVLENDELIDLGVMVAKSKIYHPELHSVARANDPLENLATRFSNDRKVSMALLFPKRIQLEMSEEYQDEIEISSSMSTLRPRAIRR